MGVPPCHCQLLSGLWTSAAGPVLEQGQSGVEVLVARRAATSCCSRCDIYDEWVCLGAAHCCSLLSWVERAVTELVGTVGRLGGPMLGCSVDPNPHVQMLACTGGPRSLLASPCLPVNPRHYQGLPAWPRLALLEWCVVVASCQALCSLKHLSSSPFSYAPHRKQTGNRPAQQAAVEPSSRQVAYPTWCRWQESTPALHCHNHITLCGGTKRSALLLQVPLMLA